MNSRTVYIGLHVFISPEHPILKGIIGDLMNQFFTVVIFDRPGELKSDLEDMKFSKEGSITTGDGAFD